MCGILFWNGSLNRELVSFFAFLDGLRFKGDFVGYEQRYSWSPVLSIGMKYLFTSPPFQSIRVLCPRVSLSRQQIEGFCFGTQSGTLCLLMAAFGPGTIQVVIDRCLLIAIWSLVFPLSLCFSFLLSFPLGGWVLLILCWSPFLFRFLNVVLAFGLGLPCFVIMLTPSIVCSL